MYNLELTIDKISSYLKKENLLFLVGQDIGMRIISDVRKNLNIPIINLSLILSKELLELSIPDRQYLIPEILKNIITKYPEPALFLYNIEVLFESSLRQDPVLLLQCLSLTKKLLVYYPGEFDGKYLIYSEPGHKEYLKHPVSGDIIIGLSS